MYRRKQPTLKGHGKHKFNINPAVRNCIRDRCAGLRKNIEKKIIHDIEKERKIVIKIDQKKKKYQRVHRIACSLYADPHVHGFNKKNFDAQTVGDWVLYRGMNLAAHYRGKRFGSWVGPIKFGVRLFHHKIYSIGFSQSSLRIDGKVVNIPHGELKLNGGGIIRRAGTKLTFSTDNGEDVDFIAFGFFFNAYVRSSVRHITGICSQKFVRSHFFRHSIEGRKVIIKRRVCKRRKLFKKQCQLRGLIGKRRLFCTRDLCSGLPVRIEREILHDNKHEKHVKLIKERIKVQRITCELYADPHVKGFNKHFFNAQTEGDWVLYRGSDVSAHYRGKRFGAWVGPIKFGIRVHHTKIYTIGFTFDNLLINGEKRHIANGRTELHKGYIIRANNKITFSNGNGEEVDLIAFGFFFNAYVRSNVRHVTGICSQKFERSTFFNHPHHGKIDVHKKQICPNRKIFRNECKRRGLRGDKLRFCVTDRCAGLSHRIEKEILKENSHEKHKLIHVKRVHRVQCQLYADPHVKSFTGKNFQCSNEGDWVIYRGLNMNVHYRGKRFGSWVGPVQYGIRIF